MIMKIFILHNTKHGLVKENTTNYSYITLRKIQWGRDDWDSLDELPGPVDGRASWTKRRQGAPGNNLKKMGQME